MIPGLLLGGFLQLPRHIPLTASNPGIEGKAKIWTEPQVGKTFNSQHHLPRPEK